MGFFDWVMNGLGFEGESKKKDKKSKTAVATEDKYANFNLHEKVAGDSSTAEQSPSSFSAGFNNFGIQAESNIIMVEPKNHGDMRKVIDYLKQGQTVAVNLEGISSEDSQRILDFFSGAIYGLNGSIHRWYGDLFLLAPEGHKILKPNENK